MKVTTSPAPRRTMLLEVELPADRLQRSIEESVRHIGRRTRIPGFRPGKVPRQVLERALGVKRGEPGAPDPIYDDAKEHLFEGTVVEAVRESDLDVLSIPEPEWVSFVEGEGATYRVVLPLRPDVKLGAYTDYPFGVTLTEIDDARVDQVIDELRDQNAALVPVADRGARDQDYAVIAFRGTREGQPFEGGEADRLPLLIGAERMIPGFEAELRGMREGEQKRFALTFPDDYPDGTLPGQKVDFEVTMRELRQKSLPERDDDFAVSLGYGDLDALHAEVRRRLEANARDRARHEFSDRIIEFAVSNATVELPELLVEREVETMLDELRIRLAEQGIGYEEYLRVRFSEQPHNPGAGGSGTQPARSPGGIILPGDRPPTQDPAAAEARLREEYRGPAERRVKALLVVTAIADAEAVEVDDAAVEAELDRLRQRQADSPKLVAYFSSARGRAYLRSTLRRSATVERLVDRWLEAHPEVGPVDHLHDDPGTPAATVTA
jgi:trigger factor